jgi:GTP-binding protein YchF
MPLQIGIVGLPNAGKSTLFNALTEAQNAAAENFPFCTIEPNVGKVPVKDDRLNQIAEIARAQKVIPETVEFVDIAGLVAGASKGEGLGNKFLANIRETDAVLLVLRFFADSEVTHVEGSHDPKRDKEILETELILKDLETTQKAVAKVAREAKSGNKEKQAQLEVYSKILKALEEGEKANSVSLDKEELKLTRELHLLTFKPFLFAANVGEAELAQFNTQEARKLLNLNENEQLVGISAKIEAEIAILEPEEKQEFLNDLGLSKSGLETLVAEAFEILGLNSYFTAGEKEARAWAFEKGSTAPEAAGKIHTDFQKGFIKADQVRWQDFIASGGWQKAREKGQVQSVGKDYLVQDGDVLLFKFNV